MRLQEILREDISPEASVRTIVDILTTQLPSLYRQLEAMAEKYAANHGRIDKGFSFVSGGPKSRWFHSVYFKELKPALYSLLKSLPPKYKDDLADFLNKTIGEGSFRNIQDDLLDILGDISTLTKNQKLKGGVSAAKHAVRNYQNHLAQLNRDEEDDIEEPVIKKPEEPNLARQQNAAVEEIINDALARLGGKQAGEIRNAIAKSGNKLQALQKEFEKRGITL
jgi:hypothetical protein